MILRPYVNGEYQDATTDIGKLMHDFNCTDASEMHFHLIADRTRYLKENPKGVNEMCKVMEDMRRAEREEGRLEGRAEGRAEGKNEEKKNTILRMLADGTLTIEKIAEFVGLPLDDVKKLISDAAV